MTLPVRVPFGIPTGVERVWHPYTAWEDWAHGMWAPTWPTAAVAAAAAILADPVTFHRCGRAMVAAWPVAAEHNLTDATQNRRSWVGQAACCHAVGAPEGATRAAWWTLPDLRQRTANRVADAVIIAWLRQRERGHAHA